MINFDNLTDTERIIAVDCQFYVKLMENLVPTERWVRPELPRGLVLYTYPNKRLVFVPVRVRDEVSSSTPSE
jgi:hypothetical protein